LRRKRFYARNHVKPFVHVDDISVGGYVVLLLRWLLGLAERARNELEWSTRMRALERSKEGCMNVIWYVGRRLVVVIINARRETIKVPALLV